VIENKPTPPALPASEPVSAATPTSRKEEAPSSESVATPGKQPHSFKFTHRGQTETVEFSDYNGVVAEALGKDPLKSWYGETIVKSFGNDKGVHYREHLRYHFGVTSAASLTWKMLGCLQDHVVAGVEYPQEYHPTPKKEAKPKSDGATLDPQLQIIVDTVVKGHGGKGVPKSAMQDVLGGIQNNILSLTDENDRETIRMTLAEAYK
jgi:hypothetical protein